jgi:hypothetical protein
VVEPPEPEDGGRAERACPECGLGFTSSVLRFRPRSALGRWWARRRGQHQVRSHAAERADILRRRTFAIYGLDARWEGRRWAGGWGSSAGKVDRIDLAHGDAYDENAPLVRIETLTLEHDPGGMQEATAAQGLAQHLWLEGGDHDAVRPTFTSPDPTESWGDLALMVDGQRRAFRFLAAGSSWVALGRVGDRLVAVEARHLDPAGVGLVTIDDVEPYLADDGLPVGPHDDR